MQISKAKVFQAEERSVKVPKAGLGLMYVRKGKEANVARARGVQA